MNIKQTNKLCEGCNKYFLFFYHRLAPDKIRNITICPNCDNIDEKLNRRDWPQDYTKKVKLMFMIKSDCRV